MQYFLSNPGHKPTNQEIDTVKTQPATNWLQIITGTTLMALSPTFASVKSTCKNSTKEREISVLKQATNQNTEMV